ncbi:MAG TPA: hypothetical protein VLB27_04350, partial [candidate division Zixibacteria bacterium]|nr:hypothetical protein [candidate division Zixibacteria bacterium]
MPLPWLTSSRALSLALICLAAQAALYLTLVLPDYNEPRMFKFITLSIALSGLWLIILGLYTRLSAGRHLKVALIVGVVCGLAFRITLLVGAGEHIHLSDDVYRYVWDGKVTAHGINPLGISPDQLYYSELPDERVYPKVNHPTLPSIYPPMSQFFFVVAYVLDSDGILGFK